MGKPGGLDFGDPHPDWGSQGRKETRQRVCHLNPPPAPCGRGQFCGVMPGGLQAEGAGEAAVLLGLASLPHPPQAGLVALPGHPHS